MSRFALPLWLLVPLLFWVGVLALLPERGNHPRLQAAMRFPVDHAAEYLWEYTGGRPAEGEELILFGRQGTRYPATAVTLVAYEGERDSPPTGTPIATREIPITDYFSHGWMAVPHWGEGMRLFVGYRFDLGVLQFFERGPWPSAPLLSRGWLRRDDAQPFLEAPREEFGQVDIRLLPEGMARARSLPNRPWEIRGLSVPRLAWLLTGAFAVLFAAGLAAFRRRRLTWAGWCALHLAFAWNAAGALLPSQYTWTSYHLDRLGQWPFWAGIALLQALLLPPLVEWAMPRILRVKRRALRRVPHLAEGFLVVFLAALFTWLCASHTIRAPYGDATGALISPHAFGERHNPLSSALFYAYLPLHDTLLHALTGREEQGFSSMYHAHASWFVVLWAPVYLLGCWGIALRLGRHRVDRWMLWAVMLSGKLLSLHFGYLEVYGPALAVMAVAFWLLLRSWQRSDDVVCSSGAAFFSYLFHLGSGGMLPFVALLWIREGWRVRFHPAWLLPRLAATALLSITAIATTLYLFFHLKYRDDPGGFAEHLGHGGLAWLRGSIGLEWEQPFLSLGGDLHYTHTYFATSWEHFSQWVGGSLFASGPLILFLLLIAVIRAPQWGRTMLGWAAVLSALIIAGASFMIFNYYPHPRDWDLFAIPGFLQLFALLVLLGGPAALRGRERWWLLSALLLYGAWDGGMWMVYNLSWGPPISERLLPGF